MRLHKNDMLAFGPDGARQVMRVVKMRDGQVTLAPHTEGGNLKARDAAKDDPFKYVSVGASRLRSARARQFLVTPDGRLLPGSSPLS